LLSDIKETHTLSVYVNRVPRIFGPKRDEVTGGWRKLHNEELHNSYTSPSIIIIIKLRRMRWAEHVEGKRGIWVGMPEGVHVSDWCESQKERDH
jgi:hypothetical protein